MVIYSDQFKVAEAKQLPDDIDFANWIAENGWIRRPFEEGSKGYLWDDHSIDTEEFDYDNGRTIEQLHNIYTKQNDNRTS